MKKVIFSLGLLVASICAFGQKSLVYKITGNGLDTPSYVMGTIHMICEQDYKWTPAMETAFTKTGDVCLEINLTDQATQMALGMAMMNQGGKPITSYFTETEKTKLLDIFNKMSGQSEEVLNMLKPAALLSLVTIESFDCSGNIKSYETELMTRASAGNRAILGIESVETQIEALSSISDSTIIAMSKIFLDPEKDKETAAAYKKYLDETKKMVAIYKDQDVDELYKYTTSSEMFQMSQKVMLDDRNLDWIPKMSEMMKSKPVMFAFGAAHLGGELGVLNQLRKSGYTITPVLQ